MRTAVLGSTSTWVSQCFRNASGLQHGGSQSVVFHRICGYHGIGRKLCCKAPAGVLCFLAEQGPEMVGSSSRNPTAQLPSYCKIGTNPMENYTIRASVLQALRIMEALADRSVSAAQHCRLHCVRNPTRSYIFLSGQGGVLSLGDLVFG